MASPVMTPAKAIAVRNYVRKYGKAWTVEQVMAFFVEVARSGRSHPAKGTEA